MRFVGSRVNPLAAISRACARGAPSQRRRSAERPTFRWSAERPAIRPTRPARAGWSALRRFRLSDIPFCGRRGAGRALDDQTDPLAPAAGRRRRFFCADFVLAKCGLRAHAGARALAANDDDDDVAAGRAARFSHGVYAKPAALKDQPYHPALTFFSPNPRAREGRAAPATSVSRATRKQVVSRATGAQADPRRWPPSPLLLRGLRFSEMRFAGARWSSGVGGER